MKDKIFSLLKKHPLAIILLIALIVYILWVWLPLGLIHSWNEAYYMLRMSHIAQGGSYLDGVFDNPPLFVYCLVILSRIFGLNLILFRILIIFCTLVIIYLIYQLGEIFGNKKIALVSSSLFAFFPMIVIFSKIIQIDIFAIMLMTASFYFAVLGIKSNKKWFFLSGFSLGLCVFSKLPAGFVIIPIFYYMYTKKIELKYFLIIIFETILFQTPWVFYVLITKPVFFKSSVSSSTNFFGLGVMHNDAPFYELAMILLAILVFISLLILFWKYKPISVEEKTLALFSLIFSGFFVLLPNHEYYLLPIFVPLFLFIGIIYTGKKSNVIKNLILVFLAISIILVIIRPVYDVNWEEAVNQVKDNYPENIFIYSSNPEVIEYYIEYKVNWLNPNTIKNISKNNTIIMFTCYDKINLEELGLIKFIENDFTFLKYIEKKIFIYGSKDLT